MKSSYRLSTQIKGLIAGLVDKLISVISVWGFVPR